MTTSNEEEPLSLDEEVRRHADETLEKAEAVLRELTAYHCDRGRYVTCGGCLPCRARALLGEQRQ